jgi:hypothetical protein
MPNLLNKIKEIILNFFWKEYQTMENNNTK